MSKAVARGSPSFPGSSTVFARRARTDPSHPLASGFRPASRPPSPAGAAPGRQGAGYAVPVPGHSVERGGRQYNTVWYCPMPEEGLRSLMTDDTGRYYPNGIPPALLNSRIRQQMIEKASQVLAPQFAEA